MNAQDVLRPRWGTFSVIDHINPAGLVPEILLYDRLVFPTPTDEADRCRWEDEGWNPGLLDQRLQELKGLVHTVPWTPELRAQWSARWDRMRAIGRDSEQLAMALTPFTIATSAFFDAVPPPVMIAAYQDPSVAIADIELAELDTLARATQPHHRDPAGEQWADLQRKIGVLFERRLEMPRIANPQKAYEKAIEVAHMPNFQRMRRSLFEWEDRVITAGWSAEAATRELNVLVNEYDAFTRMQFGQTWKRRVFHAVQIALPAGAAALSGIPLLSAPVAFAIKLIEARFPSISASPKDLLEHPGAAMREAEKAISVMYHDPPDQHQPD
jgi:hypothetical protein